MATRLGLATYAILALLFGTHAADAKPHHQLGTLSCSFDRDLCGWSGNAFHLEHSDPQYFSPSQTSYLLARAHEGDHQNYVLNSTEVVLKARTQLSFKYNIFNSTDLQSFGIYLIQTDAVDQKDVLTVLWQLEPIIPMMSQTPFNTWLPARVDLIVRGPFHLRIEAGFSEGSTGRVGIDDLVVNQEASLVSHDLSTDTGPPFTGPLVPSITCSPDKTATLFCGWKTRTENGTTVGVGTLDGISSQGYDNGHYLHVVPAKDISSTVPGVAVVESGQFTRRGEKMEFSFWYQLKQGTAQLVLFEKDGLQQKSLVELDATLYFWKPVVYTLPEADSSIDSSSISFGFRVEFPPLSTKSLFALDNVWYDAESGFEVGEQFDAVTMKPTSVSRARDEAIVIGLASAVGVLGAVVIILALLYCYKTKNRTYSRKKRRIESLSFCNDKLNSPLPTPSPTMDVWRQDFPSSNSKTNVMPSPKDSRMS